MRAAAISELAIWPAKITLCRMNCRSANHRIKYTQTRRLASIFFLLNLSRGGPVCSEQNEFNQPIRVSLPQGIWNRREIQLTRPALPYDYTIYMLCRRYSICIRNYRKHNNLFWIFLIQMENCLQSMYNHMVRRAASVVSPFYFVLLALPALKYDSTRLEIWPCPPWNMTLHALNYDPAHRSDPLSPEVLLLQLLRISI